MEPEKKQTGILSAAVSAADLIIVLWTIYCLISFFLRTGDGNMAVAGSRCFMYFTVDSNILSALCSAVVLILKLSGRSLSKGAVILKQAGTVAVTLTLMVVLCFLGPIMGYKAMFAGNNLYMHLIGPLLAIFSLTFCKGEALTKKESLAGLIPVVLYGLVYLYMVVISKRWFDFYHFNMGGLWPVTFIVILAASSLFCLLLRKLYSAAQKNG